MWDAYLSAALHSGNTLRAVVIVAPDTATRLPPLISANTWQESRPMFIDLNRWSYAELNVPSYPAERVMKSIGRDVCRTWLHSEPGKLRILARPQVLSGARDGRSYDCELFTAAATPAAGS